MKTLELQVQLIQLLENVFHKTWLAKSSLIVNSTSQTRLTYCQKKFGCIFQLNKYVNTFYYDNHLTSEFEDS